MNSSKDTAFHKTIFQRMTAPLVELFGLSSKVALFTIFVLLAAMAGMAFWSFHSVPRKTIVITAGPPGSIFEVNALKYQTNLWNNHHIRLKILNSQGSSENLQRLDDPGIRVDVGFIQGGITNGVDADGNKTNTLVSLGSISYQPLLVFYRNSNTVDVLSQFAGKRLAVGPTGSGTRAMALMLLATNGIAQGGGTELLDWDSDRATKALLESNIDAVFLMGDSASPSMIRQLLRAPGIQLMSFAQAEGYSRRISFLNDLKMPRGAVDFGKDIPAHDVQLVGPTVELIARPTLHPALVDLLIEAAQDTHGHATMFQHQGEFPSLQEHDFPISEEVVRFKERGKTFLYRNLPFGLAAIMQFIIVAFVPILVVAVPTIQLIPKIYKWRVRLNYYRWYRALMRLERQLTGPISEEKMKELMAQLDQIATAVNKMRVPASLAMDYYSLRGHVDFVRSRLMECSGESVEAG